MEARRRLGLVVLDEPTRSLDPVATAEVGQWLRQMAVETGQAVLLSSHQLEEVVACVTQIAILIDRELRYFGRPRDLQLESASPASEQSQGTLELLLAIPTGLGPILAEDFGRAIHADRSGNRLSSIWE